MWVHRLPHETEGELEYLHCRPKSGVAVKTTPRQSGTLKRVVENDSILLGD